MKQNRYDDEDFFEIYSRFPRSVEGLAAAGEWPALQKMLPPLKGRRVLDVGCGFGWHCLYAAQNGAARVVGTDISEKMLAVAREKNSAPGIEYRLLAMEDLDYPPGSFDVVISSLAFHYTPDFGPVCEKIARCLAPGGDFVFSAEHPVFTAYGSQSWVYGADGEILHWPVDRYFSEGKRDALFLGERVEKYHRTLATYLQTLLAAGFAITDIAEPTPTPEMLQTVAGMQNELRRPMMLLVAARRV